MKKFRFAAMLVAVLALLPLGGCRLYGNGRARTESIEYYESKSELRFYLPEGVLIYDRAASSLALDETGEALPSDTAALRPAGRTVLEGNTFPRYRMEADGEYEPLVRQLSSRARNPEDPLIQAYALEGEAGTAYGFCNEYTSATGFLSGGGQIDADKAYAAYYFTYDAASDELHVHDTVRRGCIVAFSQTHFIYYYQKAYYAQDVEGMADAVKICNDDAYDRGITHYSYARFYFSGGYCAIRFHRGYNNSKRDYDRFILCTMDGKTLGNIKINRAG